MKKQLATIERFIYRHRVPFLGGLALLLVALPFMGASNFFMRIVINIGVFAMLGLGLNMLTGVTGLVSLGHAGFMAIGGYATVVLMTRLEWNFFAAALVGAVLAGLAGWLIGMPSLRLSGNYLTIVTLGFGELVRLVIMTWTDVTNGMMGIFNIPRPRIFGLELTLANNGLYYLMLAFLLVATLSSFSIMNSRTGRAFLAVREDEIAATMMGIHIRKFKVLAFVISAMITGFAGAFYAPFLGFIDHNTFDFNLSILIISVVIIGGMGTIRGMFLGAIVLIAFPEVARPLMEFRFVIYGLLLILMMRFRPQGLLGWRSTLPFQGTLSKEETSRKELFRKRRLVQ